MLRTVSFEALPPSVFVSHSYDDQEALQALLACLPPSVAPLIHKAVPADPSAAVSDGIVEKILSCGGLVYLRGGQSAHSEWVAFERDYAWRAARPVFAFDPDDRSLCRHDAEPATLRFGLFASASQLPRIRDLLAWLRDERFVELDVDLTPTRLKEIPFTIADFLEEGVGALWFVDQRIDAVATLAMVDCTPDVLEGQGDRLRPARDYEGSGAWLDRHAIYLRIDPDYAPESRRGPARSAFEQGRALDLVSRRPPGDLDWSRADDLIVRLTTLARRVRPFFVDPE